MAHLIHLDTEDIAQAAQEYNDRNQLTLEEQEQIKQIDNVCF